ncbi:glycosyltransferase family 4 protein [Bradyrhizobium sp. 195]|uniref:glycosyltransferase family 4 protein n=1 Tax=Bradyrhizobium sp. 195 TaxID=2782662 RepID=UPI0020010F6A|nr:glycosyltransferase family 4 protein [Bradyrhizobium sp. 195]UPK25709.1 glycosyltransferase family 4 protein [Bradyrhizobium sp. 195]
MSEAEKSSVVVVGALPPPMHGQAAVNAAVAEGLKCLPAYLSIIDTSPGKAKKSIAYHFRRISGVLRAAVALAKCNHRHAKTLYMPFQAGHGIVYNLFLALVARLTGFAIVLHHHSSAHTLRRLPMFALLARLCGQRTTHVALSDQMARDMEQHYGLTGRTLVSGNACHIPSPPLSETVPICDDLVVGLLANLNSEKGLQLAIDTVIDAREKGAKAKLVLAGPLMGTASEECVARAFSILGEALEVWGPVDKAKKDHFFRYVQVFLFPTTYRYEAQPLVIYEALSYGLPVISTNAGYIPEMLGRTGTIVQIDREIRNRLTRELLRYCNDLDLLVRAAIESRREFERAAEISRTEFAELCAVIAAN